MSDSLAQSEVDLGHIDQLQRKSGAEIADATTGSRAEVTHRAVLHKSELSDRA
ncbi:hypothetical protein OE88DRAFT_1668798 [Heliocybe sulcata]|uniref:Uncharacterized protein n=1 Tax=Heliocybe sulcata TaxID=5364 RepID=A0A5C3MLH0_9AGAM|nr:hypothetical protein OE88DRAFT_1668798 [Heliocybe sulcata]